MKKFMSALMLFVLILPMQAHAYSVFCTNCSNTLMQTLMKLESLQQLQTMLKAYDETVNQTVQQLASLQIYEASQLRELMLTRAQSDLASQMKKNKEEQFAEEMNRHMLDTEGLDFVPIPDPF